MTTKTNNDGLEIPTALRREPKAAPRGEGLVNPTPPLGQAGPATTAGAIAAQTAVAKATKGKPAAKKPAAKAKAKVAPKTKAKAKVKAKAKPAASAPRASKQADFIAAMRTAKGISIAEAAERFGWQMHTVRGAVAGALKKKLGLKVDAERDDKRGTVYRIN